MDKITPITPSTPVIGNPDPAVVAAAEELLAMARSGEVVALALVAVTDSATTINWMGSHKAMALLGGVSLLGHRLASGI